MKKNTLYRSAALLAAAGLFMSLSTAQADPIDPDMAADMSFAYKTYFHFHPPQDRALKHNLYPYAGVPISTGADIPV
jgi:hypothetical protein